MNYIIRVIQPSDSIHWQCFLEIAKGFSLALKRLGYGGTLDLDRKESLEANRVIIFNAQALSPNVIIPESAILFNAEQIPFFPGPTGAAWTEYVKRLKRHIVWDYSIENVSRLLQYGVQAVHCPIGYYPELSNIPPGDEDIDVVFAGSINPRRARILEELSWKGLIVKNITAYGAERNRWLRRAKIILNVHFYENPIWEIARVSHALANRKCVVSEDGGCDRDLETLAMTTTAYVPYAKIVDRCLELVRDDVSRKRIANQGFDTFSALDQTMFMRKAMEMTAIIAGPGGA